MTFLDAEGLTMVNLMPGQIDGITQVTPCFIVNVPKAMYQNITTQFLLPHTTEEDVILNIRPISETVTEVAVYMVVNTGHMTLVCGNEADYPTTKVNTLIESYHQCGSFLICIGYTAGFQGRSIYDPRWLMRKTQFTELDQEGFSRLLDIKTGIV